MKREFPRYSIYFVMHNHGVCCEMCNVLHLLHVAHVHMHAHLTVSSSKICVLDASIAMILTHCGRVMQICVFNTVKLGTSASSP